MKLLSLLVGALVLAVLFYAFERVEEGIPLPEPDRASRMEWFWIALFLAGCAVVMVRQ